MTFLTRVAQLIIILAPIVIFGWLATQWFVPSGVFFVEHVVGEHSPFIDELGPSQRVSNIVDGEQSIIADPAFFFVHPHRDFEAVQLEIWFQNEDLPIVEIGALSGLDPDAYTLLPLHNLLIDESDWSRIEQDGLLLLQREKTYGSIADFFADPPSRDKVATYRTGYDVPYRISGYGPTDRWQTIAVSLRGHHEFKTYIKDENLQFNFEYMDMNRDEGEDVVRITVFNEQGQPVAEARAGDDGDSSDDARPSGLESLELTAGGLAEGVYKVVMSTTRDVFFRTIKTPQQKIVFLNTVFIGDEVGFSEPPRGAKIWTTTKWMRGQTRHAEGIQTLTGSSASVEIDGPYEWYPLELTGTGVESVEIPFGDIEIVTEGKIAFSASQFFDPDPAPLSAYATFDQMEVDYVLAKYVSPRQEGDWLVADVGFLVDQIVSDEGTWKFSFSTPGILDLGAQMIVHKTNLWFFKDPL
jgi:hypothetical protein